MAETSRTTPAKALIYVYDIVPRTDARAEVAKQAVRTLVDEYHLNEDELTLRFDFFSAFTDQAGRRWDKRFTISRAAARGLARSLRKEADKLQRAATPNYRHQLLVRDISGERRPDAKLLTLGQVSDLMGKAAGIIEDSLDEVDDRTAGWTLRPRRELTQFVWRNAKKPLDRLVADIVTAILDIDYSEEQQRKFRDRYCELKGTDSEF